MGAVDSVQDSLKKQEDQESKRKKQEGENKIHLCKSV